MLPDCLTKHNVTYIRDGLCLSVRLRTLHDIMRRSRAVCVHAGKPRTDANERS